MTSQLTRRELLKLAGLSAVTGVTLAGCKTTASSDARAGGVSASATAGAGARPRNVIFMVADGMSAGVVSMADSFSRLVRAADTGTHWLELMKTPGVAQGMTETYSLNSMVTDSAAAASAWGSGSRVNNGSLNILPGGRELTPLASLVRQAGCRVGLVTTTTITHATPAGFAVSHPKRNDEEAIALKYLDKVDVLLGGGSRFFSPDTRKDKQDLHALFKQHGYQVWHHRSDVIPRIKASDAPARVLGTFTSGHLPYTLDHTNAPELMAAVPTLADMTHAALQSLSRGDKGFFLMVEGGRVDHAAHANDAAAVLWDQLAFDDALGAALAFAANRDDTLIIVTTDHGNANPGLNGMGGKTGGSSECFARLARFNASYDAIWNRIKQGRLIDALDQLRQVFIDHTQLELLDDHLEALAKVIKRQDIGELNRQHANFRGALGQIIGNHTGIGWTGVSHTADYATLSAIGPGAAAFQGFGRNVDAFARICSLLGIDFRNPHMTPAESWRTAGDVYHHQPDLA